MEVRSIPISRERLPAHKREAARSFQATLPHNPEALHNPVAPHNLEAHHNLAAPHNPEAQAPHKAMDCPSAPSSPLGADPLHSTPAPSSERSRAHHTGPATHRTPAAEPSPRATHRPRWSATPARVLRVARMRPLLPVLLLRPRPHRRTLRLAAETTPVRRSAARRPRSFPARTGSLLLELATRAAARCSGYSWTNTTKVWAVSER